jgi:hypothetical protein
MINELFVYGRKDSIFKSICAQITDILDRYHVSPNYGHDLNTSNLMKYIKDPNYGLQDVAKKYPMCVCVTPRSVPTIINGYRWEQFLFSLFFLKRTGYIDNTTLDNVDEEANVSMNEEPDSWSQMKNDAIQFLDILDATLKGTVTLDGKDVPFRQVVFYDNNRTGIRRLSNFNNDNISGVELDFSLYMSIPLCEIIDNGITYIVATAVQEKDPVWLSDKPNYYTVLQINALLESVSAVDLSRIVTNEVPLGAINGSNAIFTTQFNFVGGTESITINGVEAKVTLDYNITGVNQITLAYSLNPGEEILIDYIKTI